LHFTHGAFSDGKVIKPSLYLSHINIMVVRVMRRQKDDEHVGLAEG